MENHVDQLQQQQRRSQQWNDSQHQHGGSPYGHQQQGDFLPSHTWQGPKKKDRGQLARVDLPGPTGGLATRWHVSGGPSQIAHLTVLTDLRYRLNGCKNVFVNPISICFRWMDAFQRSKRDFYLMVISFDYERIARMVIWFELVSVDVN